MLIEDNNIYTVYTHNSFKGQLQMRAVVKKVDTDAKVKTYDVTALHVTNEKGEDKIYNFFKNHAAINKVNRLQVGQNVEIKMEKNGKFWNPTDVDVVETPTASTNSTFGSSQDEFRRSKEEMRRSEALSSAISYIATTKGKADVTLSDVLAIAQNLEDYLANGITVNDTADLLDTP